MCTTPFTRDDESAPYLEHALLEVLRAVADQRFERDRDDSLLRNRIERLIDGNLTDPGLGPRSIAAALGVSVRLVHSAFSSGDRTIARTIKLQRLDRAAAMLRNGSTLGVEELAAAVGYAGSTQLSRAFAARYGVPISVYRANPPKG